MLFRSKGYSETEHLCLFVSGSSVKGWKTPAQEMDIYFVKGICENIFQQLGIRQLISFQQEKQILNAICNGKIIMKLYQASAKSKKLFDLKQDVVVADFYWDNCIAAAEARSVRVAELPKFPQVERDLSIVVSKQLAYAAIEETVRKCKIKKLKQVRLFDVFENEKIGADKKSMALNFHFLDEEKTLTDKETDQMMQTIVGQLEKELHAEIRK
mgnify:CR=1 FL=1